MTDSFIGKGDRNYEPETITDLSQVIEIFLSPGGG